MAKKSEYQKIKFDARKFESVKEIDSLNIGKIAPKLDKDRDSLFEETLEDLRNNKDFFRKLIDEANEQMSRTVFKVNPK